MLLEEMKFVPVPRETDKWGYRFLLRLEACGKTTQCVRRGEEQTVQDRYSSGDGGSASSGGYHPGASLAADCIFAISASNSPTRFFQR